MIHASKKKKGPTEKRKGIMNQRNENNNKNMRERKNVRKI